jgi:adenylate cyclase
MKTEIERKFLVSGSGWRGRDRGVRLRQGYLSLTKERSVRVRLAGDKAFLTIKGESKGAVRPEYEYEIPPRDAADMLDYLCVRPLIEKTRYRIDEGGHTWEVDDFSGDNAGLVVAEVELAHEDQEVSLPDWIGPEVTDRPRYLNVNLVQHPYCDWSDQEKDPST